MKKRKRRDLTSYHQRRKEEEEATTSITGVFLRTNSCLADCGGVFRDRHWILAWINSSLTDSVKNASDTTALARSVEEEEEEEEKVMATARAEEEEEVTAVWMTVAEAWR
ncbi:hypothetical protein PIB30_003063 [Stylosanthes scabra]|uniref:Uncharacterized protein n=1 Tax=Stylosanthes scabra TaxID=79078 RepID=A0ABU6X1U4_9FABA|nr:hypothetical protein [Stylosanthes scabra]